MPENPLPFSKDFLAAWHARDDVRSKVADIKTIPAPPADIQFKFPDVRPAPWVPRGTMYALPPRRVNETDEEYASRCVIIKNIGDPNE